MQGAKVDRNGGEPLLGSAGPWRDTVGDFGGSMGLTADEATGFRTVLVYNYAGFPNPPAVERIRVVFAD